MASLCSSRLLPSLSSSSSMLDSPSLLCSSSRINGFSSPRRSSPRNRIERRANNSNLQVVAMAPEEEKLTRRNPLDFPIEWERPKPGRRPDIFPKFSPMKTPLPPPMPYDPPEEDEEEEEKKEEEKENPDQEEEEQPDKQQ